MKKKFLLLAAAIPLALCMASCSGKSADSATADSGNVAADSLKQAPGLPAALDLEKGKPACLDFYADWCPPCRSMKPVFHDMEKKYGSKIKFISINTDEFPDLARAYGIESIPTFVFLDADHRETGRITGACPPEELEAPLGRLLER